MIASTYGDIFRIARIEKGHMSGQKASQRLGITTALLNQIEGNEITPDKTLLKKMADLYRIEISIIKED